MAVTETQTTSYFSRIGNSFRGILVGIVMFIVAFPLLFWNEGRAVKRARALTAGARAVISVPASPIDAANEGKLVFVTGNTVTSDILTDSLLGISEPGIRLSRKVEMYQWRENSKTKTEKKTGGSETKTTVYTYELAWSDSLENSSEFKEQGHDNPAAMPCSSEEFQAANVTLGDFTLAESQINLLGPEKPYRFPETFKAPEALGAVLNQGYLYIPVEKVSGLYGAAVSTPAPAPAAENAAPVAVRDPVMKPAVGDIRISYTLAQAGPVSVVARQTGNTFTAYPQNESTIMLLENAASTPEVMFQNAQNANKMMTWILRIVGFLLMFMGISSVLRPLSVLADVIPFIGSMVGAGNSVIAFLIAAPCSLVTIALAWVFYRPVLGIFLLLLAGAAVFFFIKKIRQPKAA